MDIGLQEIIVIIVIVVVLFGLVRMFGDKRYLRRSGRNGAAAKDKTNEKKV